MLIFQPALAPYMIDQYNFLGDVFEMEIIFLFNNVTYDKFDQQKLLSQLRCKYSLLLKGIRLGKNRVFRFGTWKSIQRNRPDIILGYEYSLTMQFLILLKRLRLISAKIGSTVDDSLEMIAKESSLLHQRARRFSVKHLDYLLLFSEEVAEFYHRTFHVPKDNIIVFPILQSEQRLKKDQDKIIAIAQHRMQEYNFWGKRLLLYVGRFTGIKGLSKFIEMIAPFLQKEYDLIMVMIGNGDEYEDIKQQIAEKQLENKIFLPGRFEGNELYAWYLCASGLVLPSIYEPYGAVVNEALIFGLKVLCSRYAGSRSLITPNNRLLFDPLNENDTQTKLYHFLAALPVVNIHLADKKTLTEDSDSFFQKAWGKILSE